MDQLENQKYTVACHNNLHVHLNYMHTFGNFTDIRQLPLKQELWKFHWSKMYVCPSCVTVVLEGWPTAGPGKNLLLKLLLYYEIFSL